MKQQVILLRGWTVKENYKDYYDFLYQYEINPYEEKFVKWSDTLAERPNKSFADYKARKIIFEKYIPYIKNDAIFIWHSLWWTFFLKYFEENPVLLEKFKKIILIAPAVLDTKEEVLWSFEIDLNRNYLKLNIYF